MLLQSWCTQTLQELESSSTSRRHKCQLRRVHKSSHRVRLCPATSQDCIWVFLSKGNAGKLKELWYNLQEHTREMVLSSITLSTTWHIMLLDLEVTHTPADWQHCVAAAGICLCTDLLNHHVRTTKGSSAFRGDWTGSRVSQHWSVLRQMSFPSWKASGHLSEVLFTQRKHQGLLTNGNSLSPKLPWAGTTSFFCLRGCTQD